MFFFSKLLNYYFFYCHLIVTAIKQAAVIASFGLFSLAMFISGYGISLLENWYHCLLIYGVFEKYLLTSFFSKVTPPVARQATSSH